MGATWVRALSVRRVSRLIESLVRPHVSKVHVDAAYREMARDERRETEALAWSEATLGDFADEPAARSKPPSSHGKGQPIKT